MAAVKRARLAKVPAWSADRLAAEMTGVGVPWNADIVVNLEHGRRKSLRVHELLALCWVLDVDNPVDLLVPDLAENGGRIVEYPLTPDIALATDAVRAWFRGETGPLRRMLDAAPGSDAEAEDLAALVEGIPEDRRQEFIRLARSFAMPQRTGDDDGAN